MNNPHPFPGDQVIIEKQALQAILEALTQTGFTLIGPTPDESAIVYNEISSINDLPIGYKTENKPGYYRIEQNANDYYFGFANGPTSWKNYLYPPRIKLFTVSDIGGCFAIEPNEDPVPQYAFIGVRACDLAAIGIQDHIFIDGQIPDPHYKARREKAFILAVNCIEPGETCFCASMGAGPACTEAYDLALTELRDAFLIDIGSPLGASMVGAETNWQLAGALEIKRATARIEAAKANMGRTLDISDLPDLLYKNLDHPRWDEIAEHCMACTNCTMVCPTCFCTDVVDESNLTGSQTGRVRQWDSCFNADFSYVHGGTVRPDIKSKYRQWLTHKLASWIDQFGTLGCVGCGRCITWCPVGIDLTVEIAAIRTEV